MRNVFWRCRSSGVSSVGRDAALLSSLGQVFFVVFVESVVAVFGLASVELCCLVVRGEWQRSCTQTSVFYKNLVRLGRTLARQMP
jgi:hypothetical protein